MRYWIFIFLCTISFSASAQWWHVKVAFWKHPVFPPIAQPKMHSMKRLAASIKLPPLNKFKVERFVPRPSDFSLEAAEDMVMLTAQHNMRFRIYNLASYNFSDLADLYVKQDRLSEAKWYYLQSNKISREQNDDKHTISNLMALAMIKAQVGDFASSDQDLAEARELARASGRQADLLSVEKEAKYIQDNKSTFTKTEVRYAEAATADGKGDNKKVQ